MKRSKKDYLSDLPEDMSGFCLLGDPPSASHHDGEPVIVLDRLVGAIH
jgi:hypothetical protein